MSLARRAGRALLLACVVVAVPATADATVTTTALTSPTEVSFVGLVPALPAYQVAGTAPGASDGDKVDVWCYSRSLRTSFPGGRAPIAGPLLVESERFATPAVTDVVGALRANLAGGDAMCNLRALPAGTDPRDLSPFRPRAVGFGRIVLTTDGALRTGYDVVSNQRRGRWDLSAAGADGVQDGGLYRGSNFSTNHHGLFGSLAWFGADEAVAHIAVDRRRGRLAGPHQRPTLEGATQVDVTRSVAPSGDLTVTERQIVVVCRDTDTPFPAAGCGETGGPGSGYEPSGLSLVRVARTTADGATLTVTDRWTNETFDERLTVDLAYQNAIGGDPAIGYMGGAPEPRTLGDTPDLGSLPAGTGFSMVLDGDKSSPEGDDEVDNGAITYASVPDGVLFLSPREWEARYAARVLGPGQVLEVTQALHQTQTLDQARAFADVLGEPATREVVRVENRVTEIIREIIRTEAPDELLRTTVQQSVRGRLGTCLVPRLPRRSLAGAHRAILRSGCSIGSTVRRPSRTIRPGHVIRQRPAVGTVVPAGTEVRLAIAKRRGR